MPARYQPRRTASRSSPAAPAAAWCWPCSAPSTPATRSSSSTRTSSMYPHLDHPGRRHDRHHRHLSRLPRSTSTGSGPPSRRAPRRSSSTAPPTRPGSRRCRGSLRDLALLAAERERPADQRRGLPRLLLRRAVLQPGGVQRGRAGLRRLQQGVRHDRLAARLRPRAAPAHRGDDQAAAVHLRLRPEHRAARRRRRPGITTCPPSSPTTAASATGSCRASRISSSWSSPAGRSTCSRKAPWGTRQRVRRRGDPQQPADHPRQRRSAAATRTSAQLRRRRPHPRPRHRDPQSAGPASSKRAAVSARQAARPDALPLARMPNLPVNWHPIVRVQAIRRRNWVDWIAMPGTMKAVRDASESSRVHAALPGTTACPCSSRNAHAGPYPSPDWPTLDRILCRLPSPCCQPKGSIFMTKVDVERVAGRSARGWSPGRRPLGPRRKPSRSQPYVVLVGISEYADKHIKPRPHAEDDAKALYDLFTNKDYLASTRTTSGCCWAATDAGRNSQLATKENILKALRWVRDKPGRRPGDLRLHRPGRPLTTRAIDLLLRHRLHLQGSRQERRRRRRHRPGAGQAQEPAVLRLPGRHFKGFDAGKEPAPDPNLTDVPFKEFLGNDGKEEQDAAAAAACVFLATGGPSAFARPGQARPVHRGLPGRPQGSRRQGRLRAGRRVTVDELTEYLDKEMPELARQQRQDRRMRATAQIRVVLGGRPPTSS